MRDCWACTVVLALTTRMIWTNVMIQTITNRAAHNVKVPPTRAGFGSEFQFPTRQSSEAPTELPSSLPSRAPTIPQASPRLHFHHLLCRPGSQLHHLASHTSYPPPFPRPEQVEIPHQVIPAQSSCRLTDDKSKLATHSCHSQPALPL
jgi:hypothetical protein